MRSPEFSAVILRYVMKKKSVTQAELARMTKRDPSYIAKVMNAECGLPTDALQLLALKSGISLPVLVIEAQLADEELPAPYKRFLRRARKAIEDCWESAARS